MRVVFYARVSTNSDDQLNSLQNQMEFFNEYFLENKYTPVEDCGMLYKKNKKVEFIRGGYADEGISGKSLKKREAFKQMILDAKEKKFDLIVTKSVARFARSVEDNAKSVKDLKELGIGIYFLDLKINSLDSSKEFMINLFSSLAQEESNSKSYIVQFGIRKAQRQGKFTGHAPYGYNIIEGFLKINETEEKIVKKIFDMYKEGYGTGKIARTLNHEKIPTKKGVKWSQIQISRILENTIYKGLQIQHISQNIDVNRDIRKMIPEEEWIRHQIEELIIIEPKVFDLVQFEKQKRLEQFGEMSYSDVKYVDEKGMLNIIKKRRLLRGTGRHSNQHLFSNILYCGNCGAALKRKKRRAHVRKDLTSKDLGYEWVCSINDMYGKDRCAFRNAFSEEYLFEYISKEIENFKINGNHEWNLERFIDGNYNTENIKEDLAKNKDEILETESMVNLNFNLLSKNKIDEDEYTKRNTSLQIQIKKLNLELYKLVNIDKGIEETKIKYEEFIKFLNGVDKAEITNSTLKKLLNKINVYTPDNSLTAIKTDLKKIIIDWNFINGIENDIIIEVRKEDIKRNGIISVPF